MFSYKISRWSFMFLLLVSCSTKEQPKRQITQRTKEITTFEKQVIEPVKKDKKPSKRIYESYIFRKLSNSFDFRIRFNYKKDNLFRLGVPLIIDICHKQDSSKKQTIVSKTEWLNSEDIIKNVSSLETKINLKNSISQDSPYYFVVGDYNFDSLVDFVVVNNIPPCSGTPTYNFYFQKSDSTFYFNKKFTEQVLFLPQSIDLKRKTFDVNSHSGCCLFDFKTFRIDKYGKIKLIRHKKNEKVKVLI